jgi:hypothetical protein
MDRPLTPKQKKFVAAYCGNVAEAAKIAGFTPEYGRRMFTKGYAHVAKKLHERVDQECNKEILSRQERQKFWSEVVKNKRVSMQNRLKASELLGKSEADFVEIRRNEFEKDYIDALKAISRG